MKVKYLNEIFNITLNKNTNKRHEVNEKAENNLLFLTNFK